MSKELIEQARNCNHAHEMTREGQATPREELERQIMSSLVPKNEREHWAAMEIKSLREQVTLLRDCVTDAIDMTHNDTMRCRWCDALAATEPTGESHEQRND